jgi:hypothetical protein
MKNKLGALIGVAAAALLFAAPLSAQFHKFVTVGDSLVAGEESGCVVARFQQRSWVRIVATQLAIDDFEQPLIQELPANNPLTGYPCLGAVFNGTSISVGIVSEAGSNQNALLGRAYDNLGFNGSPHIRDFVDLTTTVPGRSDLDNKAAAILRNCAGCPFAGMSAVDEANSLNPDLVGLWGGNNDALDAMGIGVAIEGVTLTPVNAFAAKYDEVAAALSAPGRTVIAFNIPNINVIPFATTIPPVVVNPATLQPVIVDGKPVPLLGPGDAAYPCDPAPPCGLPPGTLVTLPASALLSQGIGIPASLGGTGLPLPHGSFVLPATVNAGVVLYPDDVSAIADHIDGYNGAIASSTTAHGIILVDFNALLTRATQEGFTIGGITLTTKFLTGGLFSYDGVHPSAIGYGVIAQAFIRTLNAATASNIPEPNFSQILFTPNIAAPPGAGRDGGLFHYSLSTWKELLSSIGLPNGIHIQTPAAPTRRAIPVRTTRVVTRQSDAGD